MAGGKIVRQVQILLLSEMRQRMECVGFKEVGQRVYLPDMHEKQEK